MATEEELKKALKAFKKKLKLARLDDESGLSRGGGKKSGITGITPETGHPPGIWEELVKAGELRREMGYLFRGQGSVSGDQPFTRPIGCH